MIAYLVLITWPDGREGLLFPRPGHVQVANTPEMGEADFVKAKADLIAFEKQYPPCKGATVQLIQFERQEVLKSYTV